MAKTMEAEICPAGGVGRRAWTLGRVDRVNALRRTCLQVTAMAEMLGTSRQRLNQVAGPRSELFTDSRENTFLVLPAYMGNATRELDAPGSEVF